MENSFYQQLDASQIKKNGDTTVCQGLTMRKVNKLVSVAVCRKCQLASDEMSTILLLSEN